MQGLDVAVGLGSAGADQGVADAELVEGGAEVVGAELAAVVGEDALELPAGPGEVGADPAGELGGLGSGRVACGQLISSAQA